MAFDDPHQHAHRYVVANKWFTYPMFLEPVLSFFDFWAKWDVDVCFRRKFQVRDVLAPLVASRAVFYHAKVCEEAMPRTLSPSCCCCCCCCYAL